MIVTNKSVLSRLLGPKLVVLSAFIFAQVIFAQAVYAQAAQRAQVAQAAQRAQAAQTAAADPAASDNYRRELLLRAEKQKLWNHEQWLRFGHYRRALFGGFDSEADGSEFFLAQTGKLDPRAELYATVTAFFTPLPLTASNNPSALEPAVLNAHPLCRFPARYLWLKEQLKIDESRLPTVYCPKLSTFLSRVQPAAISLVFASYYLHRPASAFGHTFLRVHRRQNVAAGRDADLLDYGADFAAQANMDNLVAYAWLGLTGGFRGVFNMLPYYIKVREYNDVDSRDLWEYELALTDEEVLRLVLHLWELGSTYFDYFYASENCSYHILGALEAAAPRVSLLGHNSWPTIPANSMHAVLKNAGLLRAVHYRPSLQHQLDKRLAGLNHRERAAVKQLTEKPDTPWPNDVSASKKAAVLDAAADYFDLLHNQELIF